MDPQFYTQFNGTRQPVSTNTTLATLLHRADQLSTAFNHHHSASFGNVQAIQSAATQLQNLMALPSMPVTRSRPEGGMKERGMVKVRFSLRQPNVKIKLTYMHLAGPRSYRGMFGRCTRRLGQNGG